MRIPIQLHLMPQYEEIQHVVNSVHRNGEEEVEGESGYYRDAWEWAALSGVTSVLDVGCRRGNGLMVVKSMLPEGARLVGCDVVPQFVKVASTRVEAVECDAHDLPFKDGEFDVVMCWDTFEHFHHPQLVAKEMERVAGRYILANCWIGGPTHSYQMSDFMVYEYPQDFYELWSWPREKECVGDRTAWGLWRRA